MKNLLDLTGKVAVVTGGASGIGLGSTKVLAEHGATVVMVGTNENKGKKVEKELMDLGLDVMFIQGDVTSESSCKSCIEEVDRKFGRLDILFNNAGATVRKKITELSEEEWDFVIDVGLKGTFLMSKYSIPLMRKSGGGSIINCGSGWGLKGGNLAVAYNAVKGGIVNMTRGMAIDHGEDNIRVNSVNPGDTDTEMLRDEGVQTGEKDMDAYLKDCGVGRPLARIGMPEDIGNAVLFLSSDLSSWITGTALVVDGGGIA
ncbi:SDR family NAD(P)-dependent oxidoreductase [Microaceticoccus formicicus]|uniref:SDR family NAD(P)-dependent oxidoreductase n=1 Tax=Microaceticoccus formicicus TaxID=3118105 RepID=UPI003CD040AE|nr:SDR family NAD(P)-dependent oxidoreductase [Peptoniphilaceae bacterium AMB_02]